MESPTIPGHQPGAATGLAGPADDVVNATRRFPASDLSVRRARQFLLEQLGAGCHESSDLLTLMLSELATNAVQHADAGFDVDIAVTEQVGGRSVRVSVSDEAAGFPTPQEPAPDEPHGRWLRIVESLADGWGIEVRRDPPGKTVWFTSWLASRGDADAASPSRSGREGQAVAGWSFTDGLVERRGAYLDDRLALLGVLVAGGAHPGPDTVTDFVIDAMTADERSPDDIVVLAARRVHGGLGGFTVNSGEVLVIYYRFFGGTGHNSVGLEGLHIIAPWDKAYIYVVRTQTLVVPMTVLTRNGDRGASGRTGSVSRHSGDGALPASPLRTELRQGYNHAGTHRIGAGSDRTVSAGGDLFLGKWGIQQTGFCQRTPCDWREYLSTLRISRSSTCVFPHASRGSGRK